MTFDEQLRKNASWVGRQAGILTRCFASIGKKFSMGIAGLMWAGFLVGHLLGNLSIYAGPEAFNAYAHKLTSLGPILIAVEIVIVAFLLLHLIFGVIVTLQNWGARPEKYEMDKKKGGRRLSSSTMIWTGIVIIVFVVVHLVNLKYGEWRTVAGDPEMRDLYSTTVELFASPIYVIFYVVAVCCAGLHVSHGLQSGFRTLGLNHDKYSPMIDMVSRGFGWFVAVGFSTFPIWAMLTKGGA